jgi:hypothetical protein
MRIDITLALGALCRACAGRDPQPIATVQPTDATATCPMITAEIQANNIKVQELAGEEVSNGPPARLNTGKTPNRKSEEILGSDTARPILLTIQTSTRFQSQHSTEPFDGAPPQNARQA